MSLLEGSYCWSIGNIDACKIESPAAIISAAGVKLGAVVRKRQQMSFKQRLKYDLCSLHILLGRGVFPLQCHHVSETPARLRIASGDRRDQYSFGVACSTGG